ncbi:hypothetical protein LIER_27829 [Lithospermum erythrorhizon]|uniref:F-box domain-containing protein n=1 Tax=Lithospermum erythrorhizon TaxID=34254 RepID=A0AAV3RDF8_LITER
MEASSSGPSRATTMTEKRKKTRIEALSHDVLSMIFAFLNITQLIRCSAVCKSWSIIIEKLKLLQIQYHKQEGEVSGQQMLESFSADSIRRRMEQIAMNQHKLSLEEGPINVFQWKGHSNGVHQCRMKMGHVLTGVGDKVMRLWSAESYKCLDEYAQPDKAPLIDFDFDEGKVVGLTGSRICIWRRTGTRDIFSSREGMFTKGLCMRYIDPHAVVGCEDGRARVFDMYSRKCSQIINYLDRDPSVHMFISQRGKLGYSIRATPAPAIDDAKYEVWETENAMVKPGLVNSMEPERPSYYQSSGRRKTERPWCDHCQCYGHSKAGCWELHRKPPNWAPRKFAESRSYENNDGYRGGGNSGGSHQEFCCGSANAVAQPPPGQPPLNKDN